MPIKVAMVSLGCPKNQVDAEMMLAWLKSGDFLFEADPARADAVIINTCGFIEDAKRESIETILEYCRLKREGRIKCVAVTGCLAQRYGGEFAGEIPEADIVLGLGSNTKIASAIKRVLAKKGAVYSFEDKSLLPLNGGRVLGNPHSAYVKIAEGCDNLCTYCAIPSIRGAFRSRLIEDVLGEAASLAGQGVKEIVLIAQDTSRYGEDIYGESRLPELLEKLAQIEALRWIRVLYCYPERISDRLLEIMASHEKIVKYLDIPLQHASGAILKKMNRHGDYQTLAALIEKIRSKIPEITLRTSFIAGFPSETEKDFEELCRFVEEMRFDRLGCFAFSPEEGTPAFRLPGQLPDKIRRKRSDHIMEIQYEINLQKLERLAREEKEVEIMIEGYDRCAGRWFGRSAADAPEIDFKAFLPGAKGLRRGSFIKARAAGFIDLDMICKMI
ncbi:MAG: 30S ribosomal protein S12 methylthiotransferase RimO [Oscillospiraceae bacterium]|jgi:ribosomal protein S12 methylthiotransferase|nr:30S ribosomal protein S12 methylthiotransferase RimO [Oscillospiraceae bacterium]